MGVDTKTFSRAKDGKNKNSCVYIYIYTVPKSEWLSGNEYTRPDSCASDSKLVHDEKGETPFFLSEE